MILDENKKYYAIWMSKDDKDTKEGFLLASHEKGYNRIFV